MVGIFSKFSTGKTGHRRTQSALEEREVLPQSSDVPGANTGPVDVVHGIDVAVEFKPVEHPTEPLDNDKPVQCPLPEPSILNDGRIWKERVSAANVQRRSDIPLMKDGTGDDSESAGGTRTQPDPSHRFMLPSLSAPEHDILNILEECRAAGIR